MAIKACENRYRLEFVHEWALWPVHYLLLSLPINVAYSNVEWAGKATSESHKLDVRRLLAFLLIFLEPSSGTRLLSCIRGVAESLSGSKPHRSGHFGLCTTHVQAF